MEAQQRQNAKSAGHTSLLIIGAGPFGLAMATHARELGVDYVMVGQPITPLV